MSEVGLGAEIVGLLENRPPSMASTRFIATTLCDGVQKKSKSNIGAVVADIVKAANRHKNLEYYNGNIILIAKPDIELTNSAN